MSDATLKPESRLLTLAQTIAWWGSLFGGTLLFLHFFQIGYLPRFDLASIMGAIGSVAGLGLVLLFLFAVLLVLPGAALVMSAEAGVIPRVPARGDAPGLDDAQMKARRHLMLMWLLGALVAAGVLALIIWRQWYGLGIGLVVGSMVAWLACLALAMIWKFTPLAAGWRPLLFHAAAYPFWWGWAVLPLALMRPVRPPAEDPMLSLLLLGAVALFIHGTIYATHGESIKTRLLVLGGVLGLALFATPLPSSYLETLGRFYRFGMVQHAQLTVTDQGCAIVRAADTRVTCESIAGVAGVFRVGPVDVWTRIGADTLVTTAGDLGYRACARFLIPNTEILSFRLTSKPKAPVEHPDAERKKTAFCPSDFGSTSASASETAPAVSVPADAKTTSGRSTDAAAARPSAEED